jgi:uncharacterized protein YeaO (DUF488 family)
VSKLDVCIKRIYEEPVKRDGYRVLVDRLWPRGIKKETAALDQWLRDIAPTPELRVWFGHDPERWREFRDRYLRELDGHTSLLGELLERAADQRLTLLYAAKDKKVNHAVVLEEALRAWPATPATLRVARKLPSS